MIELLSLCIDCKLMNYHHKFSWIELGDNITITIHSNNFSMFISYALSFYYIENE